METEVKSKEKKDKKRQQVPFRFDVVGSFLRPEYLKKARIARQKDLICLKELQKVEDQAIQELVNKQKQSGLKVITDGEYRRSWWHYDFIWGLQGTKKNYARHRVFSAAVSISEQRGEEANGAKLTGKISGERHPFIDHYKFLENLADESVVAKISIPAPAQTLSVFTETPENYENTKNIYPIWKELYQDLVVAYKKIIQDLYDAGCRNLQLDDCTWGTLADIHYKEKRSHLLAEFTFDEIAATYVELNNAVIKGLPEDLVLTTHVCRGNFRSAWGAQGGYDPIAPYLFSKENVSAFYLEYDTDRAGDFKPLEHIPMGKKVVLGLVTSKTGELEEKQEVISRIKEASQYIPIKNLYLSPQCGFASTEEGNSITEEEQWAKIQWIKEIATEVWSEG